MYTSAIIAQLGWDPDYRYTSVDETNELIVFEPFFKLLQVLAVDCERWRCEGGIHRVDVKEIGSGGRVGANGGT